MLAIWPPCHCQGTGHCCVTDRTDGKRKEQSPSSPAYHSALYHPLLAQGQRLAKGQRGSGVPTLASQSRDRRQELNLRK